MPIIKRGPELLVKANKRSASDLVQVPFFLKLETILAPVGYPLIIPIIKGKAPSPGTLNTGFIIFLSNFPSKGTTFVHPKSSVAIKNGKREGTTELAQSLSPFLAAIKFEFENNTRKIVNNIKIIGIHHFLNEITKNFMLVCKIPPLKDKYIKK